jgi:hypothetical protein
MKRRSVTVAPLSPSRLRPSCIRRRLAGSSKQVGVLCHRLVLKPSLREWFLVIQPQTSGVWTGSSAIHLVPPEGGRSQPQRSAKASTSMRPRPLWSSGPGSDGLRATRKPRPSQRAPARRRWRAGDGRSQSVFDCVTRAPSVIHRGLSRVGHVLRDDQFDGVGQLGQFPFAARAPARRRANRPTAVPSEVAGEPARLGARTEVILD